MFDTLEKLDLTRQTTIRYPGYKFITNFRINDLGKYERARRKSGYTENEIVFDIDAFDNEGYYMTGFMAMYYQKDTKRDLTGFWKIWNN